MTGCAETRHDLHTFCTVQGLKMTPDIRRLHTAPPLIADLLEYLEFEAIAYPHSPEPSDTSYLNEKDLADPDIVANVAAMQATDKLISWFGQDFEGFIGLWRGPDNTPVERAGVVRLDTEGQYHIVATTIGDYLAISCDRDEFDHHRSQLIAAGFSVAESRTAIWDSVETIYNEANRYRAVLYNQDRVRRGLEPCG